MWVFDIKMFFLEGLIIVFPLTQPLLASEQGQYGNMNDFAFFVMLNRDAGKLEIGTIRGVLHP